MAGEGHVSFEQFAAGYSGPAATPGATLGPEDHTEINAQSLEGQPQVDDLILGDDSYPAPFDVEGEGGEVDNFVVPQEAAVPTETPQPLPTTPAQAPAEDPLRIMAALMVQERLEQQARANQPAPPEPTLAQRFHSDNEFRAHYMREISGGRWDAANPDHVLQAMQLVAVNEIAEREAARDARIEAFIAEQQAAQARQVVDNSIASVLAGYAIPDEVRARFTADAHQLVSQGLSPDEATRRAIAPFMSILPKRGVSPVPARTQPQRRPIDMAAARAAAARGGNSPLPKQGQTKQDIERVIQTKLGYRGWG